MQDVDYKGTSQGGLRGLFQSLEEKRSQSRKRNIEELAARDIYYTDWLVLVGRWGVIAFLALYGIITRGLFSFTSYVDPSNSNLFWKYFPLVIIWGIFNAYYQRVGGPRSRNAVIIRIGIDICFLLFFTHYTGGALSFCFALFMLVSAEAALQLRGTLTPFLVAIVSTALFGLLLAGEVVGVLEPVSFPLFSYEEHSILLELSIFLFSGVLNCMSVVVVNHLTEENREYAAKLSVQADRDSLTGTYTREMFFSQLESEIDRCFRSHQALSIILVGIDNMEKFNRKFGYRSGDQLLTTVGDVISKNIRRDFRAEVGSKDKACRYSGDIFALILPEAKPAYNMEEMRQLRGQMHSRGVLVVAKRLQGRIAEIPGAYGPVRISIGGAHWPYHGENADEMVKEAFRALMEAKAQGRNRMVVSTKGI